MGLISGLLFLPVTAPASGFRLLLEQLRDEADAVLFDEGRAFAELIELSMRHGAGQLSDDEYAAREAELLERLDSMRAVEDESSIESGWDDDGELEAEASDDDDGSLDAAPDEVEEDR